MTVAATSGHGHNLMTAALRFSNAIDRTVIFAGQISAWLALGLIGVTLFDVITRHFFVLGSTKLQELEWHIHSVLFLMCLGYAYLRNAHVRIELLHDNLPTRLRLWVELLGVCLFLIPYCLVVIYFGFDFTARAFAINEVSAALTGLPHRWIIKSFIVIGVSLLGLAGVSIAIKCLIQLFGAPDLAKRSVLFSAEPDAAASLHSPSQSAQGAHDIPGTLAPPAPRQSE